MDVFIAARIPSELAVKVRQLGKQNYTTISQIVRDALREYTQKYGDNSTNGRSEK